MSIYELVMEVERRERDLELARHWRHFPPGDQPTGRGRLVRHLTVSLRRCFVPLRERPGERPAL